MAQDGLTAGDTGSSDRSCFGKTGSNTGIMKNEYSKSTTKQHRNSQRPFPRRMTQYASASVLSECQHCRISPAAAYDSMLNTS